MFASVFLSILLAILTTSTPVPSLNIRTPRELAGPDRRGVAFNNPKFVKYFDIAGSHVTWTYNWDSRPNGATNAWYEFVPMLHSDRPDHTGKWAGDVRTAAMQNPNYPTHLLGFNEPDNCEYGAGGSCMSVGAAVAAWKTHMEPQKALKEKMYLGSPAVTNGPQGLKYLSDFMQACTGCSIDFINIHWYDSALNAAYFKQHINAARTLAAGRPIWITEFKAAGTDDQVKAFLDEVLPWLDGSSDIHRYAWFMATPGDGFLIGGGGQGLSSVGSHYTFHS